MLRFFRQIRQRLLTDDKFSKYLLYAVGEILLVVIGILIALQVDSWNQDRQNRVEEREYLARLKQDLATDLTRIQEVRLNYETRLITGLKILDSLGNNNGDVVRVWPHFPKALKNFENSAGTLRRNFGLGLFEILVVDRFAPAQVTFDELQNTGKISLIRDDSLRIALQYHYPKLEDFEVFQEAVIFDVQRTYRLALLENQISTLNQKGYEEIASRLAYPNQLINTIENYLRISFVFLNNIFYDPDSIYLRTSNLLERVEVQLNSIGP